MIKVYYLFNMKNSKSMKSLIIVESPTKAKTIRKYLDNNFEVMSSQGHIRDLPASELAVDIENNFTPHYVINSDKKKLIKELGILAKESDIVYLASDDDREGESISWHIKEVLNLSEDKIKRIVFHEITKTAIKNAIDNPRTIDNNLVNSQQARRILDRLVGYQLSPILWKNIQSRLSAGRVQSAATKLIVDREKEINKFSSSSLFVVTCQFNTSKNELLIGEMKEHIEDIEDVKNILLELNKAHFKISHIENKQSISNPSAPFTTSTLQQEASQKLGYSVSQTMLIAQHLYENGKISYMRTDSVTLSTEAINSAKQVIINDYGKEYFKERQYKNSNKLAQEAHEAIRPTDCSQREVSENPQEQKLYNLIWRRTIASQMSSSKFDKTVITISNDVNNQLFIAKGNIITFDGYLKLYQNNEEDTEDNLLPKVKENDNLNISNLYAKEKFQRCPSQYTEASLVKELENLGIGRPSTYATIVNIIQKRGYVVKENREPKDIIYRTLKCENNEIIVGEETGKTGGGKNKLYPSPIAFVVNDYLEKHFAEITDSHFTANVESKLDDIAEGKYDWISMLNDFYQSFSKQLEICLQQNEKVAKYERVIGLHPSLNKEIKVRIGQYGPVIQIGEKTETSKPQYIKLPKSVNIETISLEEILPLLEYPRQLGQYENVDVSINIGQYGPYVKYDKLFVSIPNTYAPKTISLEEAIELIKSKQEIMKLKEKDNNEEKKSKVKATKKSSTKDDKANETKDKDEKKSKVKNKIDSKKPTKKVKSKDRL